MNQLKSSESLFDLLLFVFIALIIGSRLSQKQREPTLRDAGEIIRQAAVRSNPALRGQNLRINGTLAVDGGPSSCACYYVCDGNGENCTECICDPEGCGSCD